MSGEARNRRAGPLADSGPSAAETKQDSPRASLTWSPEPARRAAVPLVHSTIRGPAAGRATSGSARSAVYRRNSGAGVSNQATPGTAEMAGAEGSAGAEGALEAVKGAAEASGIGERAGTAMAGSSSSEQFGDVDVLAGQAGPDHVVGVGEQLDPGAVQVGVQAAGGHEHGLARLQHDVPSSSDGDHAEVTGVIRGDTDRGGGQAAAYGAAGTASRAQTATLADGLPAAGGRPRRRASAGSRARSGSEARAWLRAVGAGGGVQGGGQRVRGPGTSRARSRAAASAGVRRPASTSNGVSAYSSSGLGQSST